MGGCSYLVQRFPFIRADLLFSHYEIDLIWIGPVSFVDVHTGYPRSAAELLFHLTAFCLQESTV